jgi:hypothetical protein
MSLQPLGLHRQKIRVGEPLAFGICDGEGRLLLARGQIIGTLDQLEGLLDRGCFVDSNQLDETASRISKARPEELPVFWSDGFGQVQRVLRNKLDAQFGQALERAVVPIMALVARDPDLAILQIVRPDDGVNPDYAGRHAVHTAVAGQLAAQRLGWDHGAAYSLFRAALTMNLSVAELQNRLTNQVTPLTPLQREAIRDHPHRSAELLETAGITDANWLGAVREHHEERDGKGYPLGKSDVHELALLLHRADCYTAKFSARASRKALAPDVAARSFFQADPGNSIAAALIKEFGIYPPGCTVRLKSGEFGIVMRRGATASTPVVAVITSRSGEPLVSPGRRDTAQVGFGIVAVVASQLVKVRVRLEDLARACA